MSASENQKKATIKYAKANLKRIPLDVKKDYYENLKLYVESKNISMRSFILTAIQEKLERDTT